LQVARQCAATNRQIRGRDAADVHAVHLAVLDEHAVDGDACVQCGFVDFVHVDEAGHGKVVRELGIPACVDSEVSLEAVARATRSATHNEVLRIRPEVHLLRAAGRQRALADEHRAAIHHRDAVGRVVCVQRASWGRADAELLVDLEIAGDLWLDVHPDVRVGKRLACFIVQQDICPAGLVQIRTHDLRHVRVEMHEIRHGAVTVDAFDPTGGPAVVMDAVRVALDVDVLAVRVAAIHIDSVAMRARRHGNGAIADITRALDTHKLDSAIRAVRRR